MKLISVVGARPNFVKVAPFLRAVNGWNSLIKGNANKEIKNVLVHTGQHYDIDLSESLYKALDIQQPDFNLGIGSGSHAEQVGKTMIEFEKLLLDIQPDWVVVFGDVNATMACAIAAKKCLIKVAHVEAGLRSRDMTMPEEINRIVTDRLSDLLFTTDKLANDNLIAEGMPAASIHLVGNIMIDSFMKNYDLAKSRSMGDILRDNNPHDQKLTEFVNEEFALVTLHRPSNVDDREKLAPIITFFKNEVAPEMPVIWPIHPRTRKRINDFGLTDLLSGTGRMVLIKPLNYNDFLALNLRARLIFTDSGGIQEECCLTGTPCLILRENTERPITLIENGGVGRLAGNDVDNIREAYNQLKSRAHTPRIPPLWDGKTSERIVQILTQV